MNHLHQHYDIPQKVNHVQSIKSIIVSYKLRINGTNSFNKMNAAHNEIPRNTFDKSGWEVHIKA